MRWLPFIALSASLTGLLSAQDSEDRTFRFRSATSDQDYQELSTAVLIVSGLKARSMDTTTRELSVRGLSDQVRLADWVVTELDRPVAATQPPSNLYTLQTKETENTIRVFYPRDIATTQAFMEVLTAVRTITDIRYVAPYTSHRAVVMRGTKEQIDLTEWLLSEMNRDAPQETYVFPKSGSEENQVRVLRYTRGDVQQFNEVQTMIRTLTDTRRVYPYIAKRAIVLRGTEEQVDMARWILAQVDKDLPLALMTSSGDYRVKDGELMRLFYFSGKMAPQAFLELQTNVRTATGIRRVFPFASARTLAIRGTAAQVAQAAALSSQ